MYLKTRPTADLTPRDSMLNTISIESTTLQQYASRAEAYNSTLAKPFSMADLVRHWSVWTLTDFEAKAVRREIRKARVERLSRRSRLWGALIESI